jgi:hypothetical protein
MYHEVCFFLCFVSLIGVKDGFVKELVETPLRSATEET